MKKQEAIQIFKNSRGLAKAVGVTPQYISRWPSQLTQRQIDWVVGAAYRLGKIEDVKKIEEENYKKLAKKLGLLVLPQ